MGFVTWLIDKILQARDARIKIKVLVHEACFFGDPKNVLYYFVKIINLSSKSKFTITHIWAKDGSQEKEILNPEKPLPYKLEESDIWETWFPKDIIGDQMNIYENVRVVLSNGKEYKSKKNLDVRPAGSIAK
jgi:hypothetical protein